MITLNGKRYDASTGEELSATPEIQKDSPIHAQSHKKNLTSVSAQSVDGFTRKRIPKANGERKPERSKTLMRGAVKRPKPSSPTANHKATKTVKPKTIVSPSANVDPVREIRATQTKRSQLISRFGEVKNKVKFAPIAVVEPPGTNAPVLSHKSTSNLVAPSRADKPDRFKNALETANSHKQSKTKKHTRRTRLAHKLRISPRLLNVAMVLVTGVLISSYVAFNNVPNLAMQIAATRSGVDADLPTYQPSGFAISGPIKYQPGQITINFGSNSDQRSYVVNQSKSEWNSETLLENHVATNNRAYQTFQEKGKTIYLYDGDNASWVDKGILYEIDGNSALNSDQIIRIANSL